MDKISMIGLDTAKLVFQLHGVDERGDCKLVRRLKRREVLPFFKKLPPCTVVMEACGGSHYWGREIMALGHGVKLAPARFVKRFNDSRRKNDARDAKAAAFAGRAGDLRPVPVKSEAQQAELLCVKARGLLVRQRTQAGNSLRSHLAEFGLVARTGDKGLEDLVAKLESGGAGLPKAALPPFAELVKHWRSLGEAIGRLTADLMAKAKANPAVKRLMEIPGVGPVTAVVATLLAEDPGRFASGRSFAAWLGLVPNEHSSASKRRLGAISKEGNEDLRSLLVLGAASILIRARRHPASADPWAAAILGRRPFKVAATALAARNARVIWALLKRGEAYRHRCDAAIAA